MVQASSQLSTSAFSSSVLPSRPDEGSSRAMCLPRGSSTTTVGNTTVCYDAHVRTGMTVQQQQRCSATNVMFVCSARACMASIVDKITPILLLLLLYTTRRLSFIWVPYLHTGTCPSMPVQQYLLAPLKDDAAANFGYKMQADTSMYKLVLSLLLCVLARKGHEREQLGLLVQAQHLQLVPPGTWYVRTRQSIVQFLCGVLTRSSYCTRLPSVCGTTGTLI